MQPPSPCRERLYYDAAVRTSGCGAFALRTEEPLVLLNGEEEELLVPLKAAPRPAFRT
jgi:hypothetical protein